MAQIQVNLEYPFSAEFDYQTQIVRLDLDKERAKDILSGNGFIIGPPSGKIKKDLQDPNGIFSEKYGRTLKDLNPFSTRYKCECGYTMFKINKGLTCPMCGKPVKYMDDNFEFFGWKVLKEPHFIIHPALYKSLEAFIGKDKFDHIIHYEEEKNADGYIIETEAKDPEKEPFAFIGMMAFKERFDEIMDWYGKRATTPTKKAYYEDIMREKDKIFTHSIPVFTFLLRPVEVNQTNFCHEDTNDDYVMINKLASVLNEYDKLTTQKLERSPRDKLLYGLQTHVNNIYMKLDKIFRK